MTLLVVSPDYASHLLPLLEIARRDRGPGERVVVATGSATDPLVRAAGFERVDLRLGRGSNPGVIRPEDQPAGEDEHLRAFFDATRRGMVATLRYQADARLQDLLYEPEANARRTLDLVERIRPDRVIVDHLAYGATLGLQCAGLAYDDVVLGHPSALPVGDEVYGELLDRPVAFDVDEREVAALRARCVEVRDAFTDRWNRAARAVDAHAPAVDDAFAVHGDLVRYHYVADLHPAARTAILPDHEFLGPCIRPEVLPADLEDRLGPRDDDRPLVYVSFGSFLSARGDVLARVADAVRRLGWRAAVATGSSDPRVLGAVPEDWVVREHLPQVAVLDRATIAVTHGGNNSVMEAVAAEVPMLVLPFSTDQFAGAAALERIGRAVVSDPNRATVDELAAAVEHLGLVPRPSRT